MLSRVKLGVNGLDSFLPLGELSEYEKRGLEELKPLLTKNIEAGVSFAKGAPVSA